MLLGQQLDRPLQPRLALPDGVHVAVALLEAEVPGELRSRPAQARPQLSKTFRAGRLDRLFQLAQIVQQRRVGLGERLGDAGSRLLYGLPPLHQQKLCEINQPHSEAIPSGGWQPTQSKGYAALGDSPFG
jgi:hypothetical protein